jgi:hypothetical protein
MENFGAQYTPAHLSAEDFLAVAHSGHESCG